MKIGVKVMGNMDSGMSRSKGNMGEFGKDEKNYKGESCCEK